MNEFNPPDNFWEFMNEVPLFFKLFGGILVTLVIGSFLYVIIKGLTMWASNNAAEVTHKRCKVSDKRTEVWGGSGDSSAKTDYYITFEFEDQSRVELYVKPNIYGLISIGDSGELIYQGTRFKEFTRVLDPE